LPRKFKAEIKNSTAADGGWERKYEQVSDGADKQAEEKVAGDEEEHGGDGGKAEIIVIDISGRHGITLYI
jgi:hypothetical protein